MPCQPSVNSVEPSVATRPQSAWVQENAWQQYAISYDRILPRLPFYIEVVDRHVEAMTQADVRNVIDIGAGTGNVALRLVAEGRRVTAVDLSPSMLAQLRAKLPADVGSKLLIVQQNAEALPQFASGAFDGVNMLLVLYAVERPSAALDEAVRVLRPGGAIVITEPKRCFNLRVLLDFAENYLRQLGVLETLREDWQRVRESNQRFDPSQRSRLWAENIYERLETLGFKQLCFQDSHLGNCATICGRKPGQMAARPDHQQFVKGE
ncbi:MAG: methyltransferase domain-containing protein [Verrucomicrobiae bacterium]|nr:methyltransferase domain-containing protein [Verrucomicrobiae bacterium]